MDDQQRDWHPWAVCPQGGFEVFGPDSRGRVPLNQYDDRHFYVGAPFRFANDAVKERVVGHMRKIGVFADDGQRAEAFDLAAGYRLPDDGSDGDGTDLASIPRPLRWLLDSYGVHTLAAVLHDKLIVRQRDEGALKSDVVADRFFREMLHACGMPLFLRWTAWSAVALRTRWAAGGWKKIKVVLWGVASVAGIGGTAAIAAQGHPVWALLYGLALLGVAGALWGRQWGAAIFAAITLPWVVPALLVVLGAIGVLGVLDKVGGRFDKPLPPGTGGHQEAAVARVRAESPVQVAVVERP